MRYSTEPRDRHSQSKGRTKKKDTYLQKKNNKVLMS